jgi:hypothetical protein
LRSGHTGHYAFRIGSQLHGGYEVQTEECAVLAPGTPSNVARYTVRSGTVTSTVAGGPPATTDRLYLVNVAGLREFRPVYDALSRMGFYNLTPDRIRDLQPPDAGELLLRDGSNLASVLAQLEKHAPGIKRRIEEYLGKVVPGVRGVDVRSIGPKETLEFRQQVVRAQGPWRFLAANMSDGTLRALGVLVSVFQSANGGAACVPLVGIEEPEAALHPAAAGVLLDILRDASHYTQILITSHSGDLLDDEDLGTETILPVHSEDGVTVIAPVDQAGRSALLDRLYTAGELLRLDQLRPDPTARPSPRRLDHGAGTAGAGTFSSHRLTAQLGPGKTRVRGLVSGSRRVPAG